MVLPDFGDQSHHERISFFPVFDFCDELSPYFDVRFASHHQTLELGEELAEMFHHEWTEEFVYL